ELGDRRLDADVRRLEDADQPLRIGLAEAVLEPAVVRPDAGEVRLLVLLLHEREHRALRRVEDLGVDAVLVHELEPAFAAVAARMDLARGRVRRLAVAGARPLELFGPGADAGDEAERLGRRGAHVEPTVPAVLVLDELRRRRLVFGIEPLRPEIGRLQRVRIRRNDAVRACHSGVSSSRVNERPFTSYSGSG